MFLFFKVFQIILYFYLLSQWYNLPSLPHSLSRRKMKITHSAVQTYSRFRPPLQIIDQGYAATSYLQLNNIINFNLNMKNKVTKYTKYLYSYGNSLTLA